MAKIVIGCQLQKAEKNRLDAILATSGEIKSHLIRRLVLDYMATIEKAEMASPDIPQQEVSEPPAPESAPALEREAASQKEVVYGYTEGQVPILQSGE